MNAQINRRAEERHLAPEGMRIVISNVTFKVVDLSRSGMGCQYSGARPGWLNVGVELQATIEWPVSGFSLPCSVTVRNLSVMPQGGLRLAISLRNADEKKIEIFLK